MFTLGYDYAELPILKPYLTKLLLSSI